MFRFRVSYEPFPSAQALPDRGQETRVKPGRILFATQLAGGGLPIAPFGAVKKWLSFAPNDSRATKPPSPPRLPFCQNKLLTSIFCFYFPPHLFASALFSLSLLVVNSDPGFIYMAGFPSPRPPPIRFVSWHFLSREEGFMPFLPLSIRAEVRSRRLETNRAHISS